MNCCVRMRTRVLSRIASGRIALSKRARSASALVDRPITAVSTLVRDAPAVSHGWAASELDRPPDAALAREPEDQRGGGGVFDRDTDRLVESQLRRVGARGP